MQFASGTAVLDEKASHTGARQTSTLNSQVPQQSVRESQGENNSGEELTCKLHVNSLRHHSIYTEYPYDFPSVTKGSREIKIIVSNLFFKKLGAHCSQS